MGYDFCKILLEKLVDQKTKSNILSNKLLQISQYLDPRFSRIVTKNGDGSIVLTLSAEYGRLFSDLSEENDALTQINNDEIMDNDLNSLLTQTSTIFFTLAIVADSETFTESLHIDIKPTFKLSITVTIITFKSKFILKRKSNKQSLYLIAHYWSITFYKMFLEC